MIYALILAGGSGTRFWPLSRENRPKQFLNICSQRPMLEETLMRIRPFIKSNNIIIATNRIYQKRTSQCLKSLGLHADSLFFEPSGKNTLAPIGLLSKRVFLKDKDAIIISLPCDHYIKEDSKFQRTINKAVAVAKRGYIVTIGIIPDRPETGYGYIRISSKLEARSSKFIKVEKFIEKPSLELAKKFIKDKRYYWNTGIFVFRADVILEEIKKFSPREFKIISEINDTESLKRLWPRLKSISIDYAVMEKSKRIALVPAQFSWSDLGSWQAIEQISKKDKNGNIFMGGCINVGSKNTLVWSDNRILATVGLDNIIVVDAKDALLVCAKDRAQDVKKIVQILEDKKLNRLI